LEQEGATGRLEAAGVHCLEPVGYLDFLSLQTGAGAIVTDSGGVQEEASALGVPCHTLRANTERPITISHGTNVLLGDDPDRLDQVSLPSRPPMPCSIPYWDGHAAERAADAILAAYPSILEPEVVLA
jgi:UDP-N-acetylglucosamine 2-epimerase (non-hydrolysing)